MKPTKKITILGLLAAIAATAVSTPVLADPGNQQNNKNTWRNLGIAGAVIAGYGLLEHNQTATVLGAAGAAYSADRYEQDRHQQSQDSSDRQWYDRNGGYGNGGHGYDRSNDGRYGDGSNRSDDRRDNGGQPGWTNAYRDRDGSRN